VGAAITSLTAECFEALLLLFMVFRFTKIRVNIKVLFISALCALPFFALYCLCNRIIENNMVFLITFIGACTLLYVALQRYWAKNYLTVQLMGLITNKIIKQI
jgi:hypothetical protein